MSRKPTEKETIIEIQERRAEGLTLDQIEGQMQDDRDDGLITRRMVSRNTIAKYMKDSSPEDAPFQWHKMGEYSKFGIPWESSEWLCDLWFQAKEGLNGVFQTFAPTIRQCKWWWRLHLAAPDCPDIRVMVIAQSYVMREQIQDILGEPVDVSDLDAWVAYHMWERASSYGTQSYGNRYIKAIDDGRIPALASESEIINHIGEIEVRGHDPARLQLSLKSLTYTNLYRKEQNGESN